MGRVFLFKFRLAAIAVLACVLSVASAAVVRGDEREFEIVKALLSQPESGIEIARLKLEIEKLIDPEIDVEATLRKLDAMAMAVKASAGMHTKSSELIQILRSYLYDAGAWNQRTPFRYDIEGDPFGRKASSAMLSHYLATRKGNCVSMPVLFVALGQRLGLDVSLATSPKHMFVKYRDENGNWHNIEATSGGYPRQDASYQRDAPMSELALKNGLYMRPLSRQESALAFVRTLIGHRLDQGRLEQALSLSRLEYEFDQSDSEVMLSIGYSFFRLMERDYLLKYARTADIPQRELPRFHELDRLNRHWLLKAKAVGWQEPPEDADARYLENIKTAQRQ